MNWQEDYRSAFGHICTGGGASISNSPVNVTVNLTINIGEDARLEDGRGRPTELARSLDFLGKLLQGSDHRVGENGRALDLIEAGYRAPVRAADRP